MGLRFWLVNRLIFTLFGDVNDGLGGGNEAFESGVMWTHNIMDPARSIPAHIFSRPAAVQDFSDKVRILCLTTFDRLKPSD